MSYMDGDSDKKTNMEMEMEMEIVDLPDFIKTHIQPF